MTTAAQGSYEGPMGGDYGGDVLATQLLVEIVEPLPHQRDVVGIRVLQGQLEKASEDDVADVYH